MCYICVMSMAWQSGPMEMSRDPENVNEFDDLEE